MIKIKNKIRLFVATGTSNHDALVVIQGGNHTLRLLLRGNRGVTECYIDGDESSVLSATIMEILRGLRKDGIVGMNKTITYFNVQDFPHKEQLYVSEYKSLVAKEYFVCDRQVLEDVVEWYRRNDIMITLDGKLGETAVESKVRVSKIEDQTFEYNTAELQNIKETKDKYGWAELDLNPIGAKSVVSGIKKGLSKNILITGPTGVGKSFWAAVLSVSLGMPFNSINLYADVTEETLRSSLQPVDPKDSSSITMDDVKDIMRYAVEFEEDEIAFATKIRELGIDKKMNSAKFVRVFSQFAKDYSRPGITAIEEMNLAAMALLGYLYSALDHRGQLDVGGGIVLRRHPWRIIIATMNPVFQGYTGAEPLNKALKSRMSSTIIYDDVNMKEMQTRLKVDPAIQYDNNKFTRKLFDVYDKMKPLINNARRINSHVSYRNIQNFMAHLVANEDLSFGEIFHGEFLNNLLAEVNDETKQTIRTQAKDWIQELEALYLPPKGGALMDIDPFGGESHADEFEALLDDFDHLF